MALKEAGIQESLINTIIYLYNENKCRIKMGKASPREFQTSEGLLQGCPISPFLFKLYLQVSLIEWNKMFNKMGIKLEETTYLHQLLFADDQVVIVRDGEDANYMCAKLVETYKKWGLTINYGKIK